MYFKSWLVRTVYHGCECMEVRMVSAPTETEYIPDKTGYIVNIQEAENDEC